MNGRLLYTVMAVVVGLLSTQTAGALIKVQPKPVTEAPAQVDVPAAKVPALGDPVVRAKDLAKRIDALIEKKWQGNKIKPAPKATDTEYFRRLFLDLAGQVPSLLDMRDFLDNESLDKRTEWTEKLLEGERYPIHFSYVWRGILLSNRTEANLAGQRQSFEKWLHDRLRINQGHDETARDLITLLRKPGEVGAPNAFTAYYGNKAEEQAGAVARAFLGVKIECAQCHPHPFAEWSKQQFWEFAAFFNPQGIKPAGNGQFLRPEITMPGAAGKKLKAKFLDGTEPRETMPDNPRTSLAKWATAKDNPYFAKATADHVWSYFFGVSILEPLLEKEKSGVTHPELLDLLAKELVENAYDAKHLIRAIVYTQAYQRTSKANAKDEDQLALFARMPVRGLTADQLFDSFMVATNSKPESSMINNMYALQPGFNGPQTERNQFMVRFADSAKSTEATTSILQALYLMNSKFINERIDPKSNSVLPVLAGTSGNAKRQLETLFLIALSRQPTATELGQLVPYVETGGTNNDRAQAFSDVLWALLNSSEFALNH